MTEGYNGRGVKNNVVTTTVRFIVTRTTKVRLIVVFMTVALAPKSTKEGLHMYPQQTVTVEVPFRGPCAIVNVGGSSTSSVTGSPYDVFTASGWVGTRFPFNMFVGRNEYEPDGSVRVGRLKRGPDSRFMMTPSMRNISAFV
jgi:hypothetical protein